MATFRIKGGSFGLWDKRGRARELPSEVSDFFGLENFNGLRPKSKDPFTETPGL